MPKSYKYKLRCGRGEKNNGMVGNKVTKGAITDLF